MEGSASSFTPDKHTREDAHQLDDNTVPAQDGLNHLPIEEQRNTKETETNAMDTSQPPVPHVEAALAGKPDEEKEEDVHMELVDAMAQHDPNAHRHRSR